MKRKLFLYCNKSGEAKLSGEKFAGYDGLTDWVEIEINVDIPPEVFQKPSLKIEVGVEEKRKEYTPVTKSTSFGMAELRSKIE